MTVVTYRAPMDAIGSVYTATIATTTLIYLRKIAGNISIPGGWATDEDELLRGRPPLRAEPTCLTEHRRRGLDGPHQAASPRTESATCTEQRRSDEMSSPIDTHGRDGRAVHVTDHSSGWSRWVPLTLALITTAACSLPPGTTTLTTIATATHPPSAGPDGSSTSGGSFKVDGSLQPLDIGQDPRGIVQMMEHFLNGGGNTSGGCQVNTLLLYNAASAAAHAVYNETAAALTERVLLNGTGYARHIPVEHLMLLRETHTVTPFDGLYQARALALHSYGKNYGGAVAPIKDVSPRALLAIAARFEGGLQSPSATRMLQGHAVDITGDGTDRAPNYDDPFCVDDYEEDNAGHGSTPPSPPPKVELEEVPAPPESPATDHDGYMTNAVYAAAQSVIRAADEQPDARIAELVTKEVAVGHSFATLITSLEEKYGAPPFALDSLTTDITEEAAEIVYDASGRMPAALKELAEHVGSHLIQQAVPVIVANALREEEYVNLARVQQRNAIVQDAAIDSLLSHIEELKQHYHDEIETMHETGGGAAAQTAGSSTTYREAQPSLGLIAADAATEETMRRFLRKTTEAIGSRFGDDAQGHEVANLALSDLPPAARMGAHGVVAQYRRIEALLEKIAPQKGTMLYNAVQTHIEAGLRSYVPGPLERDLQIMPYPVIVLHAYLKVLVQNTPKITEEELRRQIKSVPTLVHGCVDMDPLANEITEYRLRLKEYNLAPSIRPVLQAIMDVFVKARYGGWTDVTAEFKATLNNLLATLSANPDSAGIVYSGETGLALLGGLVTAITTQNAQLFVMRQTTLAVGGGAASGLGINALGASHAPVAPPAGGGGGGGGGGSGGGTSKGRATQRAPLGSVAPRRNYPPPNRDAKHADGVCFDVLRTPCVGTDGELFPCPHLTGAASGPCWWGLHPYDASDLSQKDLENFWRVVADRRVPSRMLLEQEACTRFGIHFNALSGDLKHWNPDIAQPVGAKIAPPPFDQKGRRTKKAAPTAPTAPTPAPATPVTSAALATPAAAPVADASVAAVGHPIDPNADIPTDVLMLQLVANLERNFDPDKVKGMAASFETIPDEAGKRRAIGALLAQQTYAEAPRKN